MLTIKDFVVKYETYSDEELYDVHHNLENYSEAAAKALNIVLEKKGGLGSLIQRLEAKAIITNEKRRIANEAAKLGLNGVDAPFIKNTTTSTILSKEELHDIIETNVEKAELIVEDKKVTSETIMKSILGCALASLVGGAFACLQFLYFGATSHILVGGMGLICYVVVKFVTKKSYNNSAVILASFVAIILSYLIGSLAFSIFGYMG
jgi:membrane-associated HD superfamily phosphohydrolase